jgi:molecular chaperone HtpG
VDFGTQAEMRAATCDRLPAFRGFSLGLTREKITEALATFGRLGIFGEYTKHDITHIDGMLRLYDWIIPTGTQVKCHLLTGYLSYFRHIFTTSV